MGGHLQRRRRTGASGTPRGRRDEEAETGKWGKDSTERAQDLAEGAAVACRGPGTMVLAHSSPWRQERPSAQAGQRGHLTSCSRCRWSWVLEGAAEAPVLHEEPVRLNHGSFGGI